MTFSLGGFFTVLLTVMSEAGLLFLLDSFVGLIKELVFATTCLDISDFFISASLISTCGATCFFYSINYQRRIICIVFLRIFINNIKQRC